MIKILHMQNGDIVIADVTKRKLFRTCVENPMSMQSLQDVDGNVYTRLVNPLIYSVENTIEYINTSIQGESTPSDKVTEYYNKAVSISQKYKSEMDESIQEILDSIEKGVKQRAYTNYTRH